MPWHGSKRLNHLIGINGEGKTIPYDRWVKGMMELSEAGVLTLAEVNQVIWRIKMEAKRARRRAS